MEYKKMIVENISMVWNKIAMLTVLSAVPAGGFSLFTELTGWYIENRIFMSLVSAAIFIDHLLGSWVHWKIKDDFTWRKNRNGLFLKIAGSLCGYVLFEMLYQIVQDVDFISMYLKVLLQVTTFFYPFLSAVKNLSITTNGSFPSKALLAKFMKFEETADLNALKTTEDEKNIDSNIDNSNS